MANKPINIDEKAIKIILRIKIGQKNAAMNRKQSGKQRYRRLIGAVLNPIKIPIAINTGIQHGNCIFSSLKKLANNYISKS